MELVDSVDDLRSSSSTRGISMPSLEVLDARIASALNKIIHNSHFKRKISLEEQKAQKEDRFLRGRQIAYLIYEQFRVTGTDSSVETYTDLFTIESSKYLQENLVLDNGHLSDQVLKSAILQRSPQGAWDNIAEEMLLEFAESGHATFRATTPLSRSIVKIKGHGKLSIHFDADEHTIETIFRIILSVNQLSVNGAVAAICEEFENHQDGSGEPVILMCQSIVLGEIKAEVPLQKENSLNHQILWQQYIERIESLSPESKVSKFCKEAGFMRVVEVGQYFVTRNASEFLLRSAACREYTLPRDDPASEAKGWIQGNMRIGPVLEVTTSFQHSNLVCESKQFSILGQNILWNDQLCGRFKSRQYRKFLQIHKKSKFHKQASRLLQPDQRQKQNHKRGNLLIQHQPYQHERRWIDIEPSEQNLASYDLSKKVISLLRHNQTLQREDDGAIEFCKIKFHLRNHHSQIHNWSDDRWIACLAAGGGSKRRYQNCSDNSGTILNLRALQGHSGDNLIDLTLQDNVLIGPGIFPYIYHVGSNFNLHSIINNGLIPGGQDLSRRQTVFFLLVDPRDERHKDPEYIDFSVPRLARYLHSAWKRHQDAVFFGSILILRSKKD